MPIWSQLGLQNASNTIMECIIYFHDYMMMILTMILIFVVYFLTLIINNNYLDKMTMDSHLLESIWTVIPMMILFFMAYPSLMMLYFMEASEGMNLDFMIKVIGHQWYWEYENLNSTENNFLQNNFIMTKFQLENDSFDSALLHNPKYFYTLETTKALNLPLNKMIGAYITSADVLHAFTIPTLGIKVDAIPGRVNILYFSINTIGNFYGQCSEICGANHSFMPIQVLVK